MSCTILTPFSLSSKSQTTLKRVGRLVEGWKGRNTRKSTTSSEDDTAFCFSGFAGDDEDDGEEGRDLSTDPKTKKETHKMVSLHLFNYDFIRRLPASLNLFPSLALQTSPFSLGKAAKQH